MTARGSRHMLVLAAVMLGAVALVACGSTTDYSTRPEVE